MNRCDILHGCTKYYKCLPFVTGRVGSQYSVCDMELIPLLINQNLTICLQVMVAENQRIEEFLRISKKGIHVVGNCKGRAKFADRQGKLAQ